MAASTKTGYDPNTMQWVEIEAAEARQDPIPGEKEPPPSHRLANQDPHPLLTRVPNADDVVEADTHLGIKNNRGSPCSVRPGRDRHRSETPHWQYRERWYFPVAGVVTKHRCCGFENGNPGLEAHWIRHADDRGPPENETSESLRHKLEWIDVEILYVRKLSTSNVAVVTFKGRRVRRYIHYYSENVPVRCYKKTVPSCYRCATVGHRPDACLNLDNPRCIHCGAKVNITPDSPTEHECEPECLTCGENHFTGSAQCTDAKPQSKQNKPKPSNVPAGQNRSCLPSRPRIFHSWQAHPNSPPQPPSPLLSIPKF
ncbi:hypothetical protein HPB52_022033 [Rhipicephalus sanguineus]|uniref:CCHC-type domain-containing protein n=1 Tax=Rhipicephalus sanguineus TaxID=34632 RepID=A0A9D4SUY3_RHISA|nr:hypothetical protein HPB52_022033 [Rhipicephalus sanguineus]